MSAGRASSDGGCGGGWQGPGSEGTSDQRSLSWGLQKPHRVSPVMVRRSFPQQQLQKSGWNWVWGEPGKPKQEETVWVHPCWLSEPGVGFAYLPAHSRHLQLLLFCAQRRHEKYGLFLSLSAGVSGWAGAHGKSVVCFKSQPYVALQGKGLHSAPEPLAPHWPGLGDPVPTRYLDDLPRCVSG